MQNKLQNNIGNERLELQQRTAEAYDASKKADVDTNRFQQLALSEAKTIYNPQVLSSTCNFKTVAKIASIFIFFIAFSELCDRMSGFENKGRGML